MNTPATATLAASTDLAADLYDQYLLGNYNRSPFTIERGLGARVWDTAGREYLDFTTGIAVNTLGHAHPHWVRRVQEQAALVAHTSNLFRNPNAGEVARRLVAQAGPGRIVYNNSGAEANEFLLKLARVHGQKVAGKEGVKYTVLTATNSFHGRLFGGMSATPQEKVQGGFRPLVPGFRHAPLNDLAAWEAIFDDSVAAVLLETVQGEGGIFPCESAFLHGLRALCDQHHALLLVDEVQCGIGRTGSFFAYHQVQPALRPDALGMAKGLGGGFPIGACWVAEAHCGLFKPGMHGSTYAGSPLATAAALAVLETLEAEGLIERVRAQAPGWHAALTGLATKYPQHLKGIRGWGYLVGLQLAGEVPPVAAAFRAAGLLGAPAGHNTLRLLPPLTATADELAESVARADTAFASLG